MANGKKSMRLEQDRAVCTLRAEDRRQCAEPRETSAAVPSAAASTDAVFDVKKLTDG